MRSTGQNETTAPPCQATSRLQRFSAKHMEHFSGIYTRAAESFTKMQQHNNQFNEDDEGPAPLDIGATTWKGKGKSKERHQRKGAAKGNKGKGFGNYHITGKGKYHNPIDQGNPFKGSKRKGKPSGNIKGKGKERKHATNIANRVTRNFSACQHATGVAIPITQTNL